MKIEIHTGINAKEVFELADSWSDVHPDLWLDYIKLRYACQLVEMPDAQGVPMKRVVMGDYLAARIALEKICPAMEDLLYVEVVEKVIAEMQWMKDFPAHAKSMRKRIGMWQGPKDQLLDWTWGRYCLAEECFRAYVDAVMLDEDEPTEVTKALRKKYINQLFAVLYAPFGIWNAKVADAYVKLARIVSSTKKAEAVENYRGLRSWLEQVYAPAFKGGGSGEDSGDTMRSLTVAMAGPKFGTPKDVLKENVHNVMIYQCQLVNEAERASA